MGGILYLFVHNFVNWLFINKISDLIVSFCNLKYSFHINAGKLHLDPGHIAELFYLVDIGEIIIMTIFSNLVYSFPKLAQYHLEYWLVINLIDFCNANCIQERQKKGSSSMVPERELIPHHLHFVAR